LAIAASSGNSVISFAAAEALGAGFESATFADDAGDAAGTQAIKTRDNSKRRMVFRDLTPMTPREEEIAKNFSLKKILGDLFFSWRLGVEKM
jgi:hypothetical protein